MPTSKPGISPTTRRRTGVIAVAGILLAAGCGRTTQPASTVVVYEGARLIVGDGAVLENASFAVDAGRFLAVGPAGTLEVPPGAMRVNLAGRTVMPAIVDAHVHLGATREAVQDDLRQRAYFGVGAALSMGSDVDDAPLALRAEAPAGVARFRSAGTGITRPEPGRREVHWIDTVDEARQAVRAEAARRVDLIKIWVDDRNGQFAKLTPALYGAVIDEAHSNGLRVAAHIFSLDDAKGLVRAGVDILAHGVRDRVVDDEFVALVRTHPDLVLIANLPPRGVQADLAWLNGIVAADGLTQPAGDAATKAAFDIQAQNLVKLRAAGITVALGTDGNTPWGPHIELEDMVAAGMTPGDALVAATRNSAAVLQMEDMGTLARGRSADFIVLDANPLEQITNTRRISAVYLRGMEVDRSSPPVSWSR